MVAADCVEGGIMSIPLATLKLLAPDASLLVFLEDPCVRGYAEWQVAPDAPLLPHCGSLIIAASFRLFDHCCLIVAF